VTEERVGFVRALIALGRSKPKVAVLVAALLVVAVGASVAAVATTHRRGSRPQATVSPGPTAPQPTSPPTTAPPTTAPATTTTAPRGSACIRAAILTAYNSYYGKPDPDGPSIDYATPRMYLLADGYDGGKGSRIRSVDLAIEIVRRDGTVRLPYANLKALGDFDGDGRTDLVVDDNGPGAQRTYLIRGSVAVGTHDLAAVGVALSRPVVEADNFLGPWWPVGDQNRDGADDLMINRTVYSGRQLTAAAPGTTLASFPPPIRTVPHAVVGVLQLDAAGPPTIVGADPAASVLVLDDRADRLTVAPGADGVDWRSTVAKGWLVGSHHIVQLSFTTRSGGNYWRWDLDAPCA
jgi:hypothetical protein